MSLAELRLCWEMWASNESAKKAANGTHLAIRIGNLQIDEDSDETPRVKLMVTRTAPARLAPPLVAALPTPDTRHHARTTTHDDEKMLRAQTNTTPETPINGVRQNWASAPATGSPPSSSHASVAHTATRPSSQGPASALRFNYY